MNIKEKPTWEITQDGQTVTIDLNTIVQILDSIEIRAYDPFDGEWMSISEIEVHNDKEDCGTIYLTLVRD